MGRLHLGNTMSLRDVSERCLPTKIKWTIWAAYFTACLVNHLPNPEIQNSLYTHWYMFLFSAQCGRNPRCLTPLTTQMILQLIIIPPSYQKAVLQVSRCSVLEMPRNVAAWLLIASTYVSDPFMSCRSVYIRFWEAPWSACRYTTIRPWAYLSDFIYLNTIVVHRICLFQMSWELVPNSSETADFSYG